MADTRIYKVTNGTEPVRLIEATSAAQAIRFAARQVFVAAIARPQEIVAAMEAGAKVEKAVEP